MHLGGDRGLFFSPEAANHESHVSSINVQQVGVKAGASALHNGQKPGQKIKGSVKGAGSAHCHQPCADELIRRGKQSADAKAAAALLQAEERARKKLRRSEQRLQAKQAKARQLAKNAHSRALNADAPPFPLGTSAAASSPGSASRVVLPNSSATSSSSAPRRASSPSSTPSPVDVGRPTAGQGGAVRLGEAALVRCRRFLLRTWCTIVKG